MLAVTVLVVGATAPPASAARRGDAARHSAGIKWDLIPTRATGVRASLRIDRALVPDRRRKGFVNQFLWVQTNHPNARNAADVGYGGKRKPPYIAAGLTVARNDKPTVFVAQRKVDGSYVQRPVALDVSFKKKISISVNCDTMLGCEPGFNDRGANDAWAIRFDELPNRFLRFHQAGDKAGSAAVYAGLEASSPDALGAGRVEELQYQVNNAGGAASYDSWMTLDKRFGVAHPSVRGKGASPWDVENKSANNRLG